MKLFLQLPGIFFSGMFWITIALISFGVIAFVIVYQCMKTPTDYNALFEGREEGGIVKNMWGEGAESVEELEEEQKRLHYAGERGIWL